MQVPYSVIVPTLKHGSATLPCLDHAPKEPLRMLAKPLVQVFMRVSGCASLEVIELETGIFNDTRAFEGTCEIAVYM